MKGLLPLLLTLSAATQVFAQEEPELGPDHWPTTVQMAVADIVKSLSDEDKATLRKTRKSDLIRFHHGWGTGIRNHYGLWRGNDKLIESACGKGCHPDDASMVIIEAVWSALQHKGEPSTQGEPAPRAA
jgi:hypothetical protein